MLLAVASTRWRNVHVLQGYSPHVRSRRILPMMNTLRSHMLTVQWRETASRRTPGALVASAYDVRSGLAELIGVLLAPHC